MGSLTVWCLTTLIVAMGVALALGLAESVWTNGTLAPRRARWLAVLGSALLLVVLAVLLLLRPVARADGAVLRSLSHSRGASLDAIMAVLTTIGDSVPSFTIAAVLAVVIYRQGVYRYACWVLPVIVLVELVIQIGMGKVFNDLTIADVAAGLTAGKNGYLPSGSVARLFVIFVITARLWHCANPRQSRTIVTVGGALLILQSVSRLYLGRHLFLDLAGGLLLGLVLFLLVSFALVDRPRIDRQRADAPDGAPGRHT